MGGDSAIDVSVPFLYAEFMEDRLLPQNISEVKELPCFPGGTISPALGSGAHGSRTARRHQRIQNDTESVHFIVYWPLAQGWDRPFSGSWDYLCSMGGRAVEMPSMARMVIELWEAS